MILVTGSEGLIGRRLVARLRADGVSVRGFDLRADPAEDIRDREALARSMTGVSGVVHLAAVSRVAWGERDPETCMSVNAAALRGLTELCAQGMRPWLIFASSREVYGSPSALPVREDAPMLPVNVYGRSKAAGEAIVEAARANGVIANICRFANVYGCIHDHPDRAAMAFAAVAARGGTMSVTGGASLCDFLGLDDAVDGLCRMIEATSGNRLLNPVNFASGVGTSLRELAQIAASHSKRDVEIVDLPAREFDVSSFVGDPRRAFELLGWRPGTCIDEGVGKLVAALAAQPTPSRV